MPTYDCEENRPKGAMTFYITKWALTKGIIVAHDCKNHEGYASRGRYGEGTYVFVKIGKDAFATEAEARARVRSLINAKLKSLDKQRNELQKKLASFNQPE
jgi:hypothetical protein